MNSNLRKSLPYFAFIILGVVTLFTYRSITRTSAPSGKTEAVASRSQTPPVAARKPVRPSPLAFLGDHSQPWQVRVTLLRSHLSGGCAEPELTYLYNLISQGPPKGELPEHCYTIANDILIQLARHDPDAERFSSNLLKMLHDPKQPLVLRDYAVQHLVAWLNPRSPQAAAQQTGVAAKPSPELTARILQSLAAAAISPEFEQTTIPGTTLMMLVDLTRFPGAVDCSQAITTLKPWLTLALQDSSPLSNPVRVSAIQAAGILAPLEFRPVLRQIAYQQFGQLSFRLPAIAALGHCGEAADLEDLKQIALTIPDLTYAAQEALKSLTNRLVQADNK